MSAISFVIPFGDAHEQRTRALEWVRPYWEHRIDAEFIVQPFEQLSKTYTLNRGIEKASGEIIIAMDADALMDEAQMNQAIDIARHGGWCIPYEHMYRLTQDDTEKILALDPKTFDPSRQIASQRVPEQMNAHRFGAMAQIYPKAAWERIGGFDERFRGWGCEDEHMLIVLDGIWADHHLLPGAIFHMEHERIGRNENGVGNGWNRKWVGQEATSPNLDLRNEYAHAAGDKLALQKILDHR
jgi:glycosyltransferase involved in cell wall biosynthesis